MSVALVPPADLAGLRVRLDAYQRTADALRAAGRPVPHHLQELLEDLGAEILAQEQRYEDQAGSELDNREQAAAAASQRGQPDSLRWVLVALTAALAATAAFLFFR